MCKNICMSLISLHKCVFSVFGYNYFYLALTVKNKQQSNLDFCTVYNISKLARFFPKEKLTRCVFYISTSESSLNRIEIQSISESTRQISVNNHPYIMDNFVSLSRTSFILVLSEYTIIIFTFSG